MSDTPEARALAEAVLRAAGSSLANYTMALSREKILNAAQSALTTERNKALEDAAKRTDRFQDVIGWQPNERRNDLVIDIEEAIRALKTTEQA